MGLESYQRRCAFGCGSVIHMLKCTDGYWRAFDFPDVTLTGNWEKHDCRGGELNVSLSE